MFEGIKREILKPGERRKLGKIERLLDESNGCLSDENVQAVVRGSKLSRAQKKSTKPNKAGLARFRKQIELASMLAGEVLDRHFEKRYGKAFKALRADNAREFNRLHGASIGQSQATLNDMAMHAENLRRKVIAALEKEGINEKHPTYQAWIQKFRAYTKRLAIKE